MKNDGTETGTIISGPKKITHSMFARSNYIGCSTVVYKRDVYPDLQIPESIKKRNDYALWLMLSKKTDCYLLNECLTKYRKGSASISSGKKSNLVKYHYQVFREACGYSKPKALLFTLLNIGFYLIRYKKYRKNHVEAVKSDKRFENVYFVIITIILTTFVFAFGYSVNSIKGESTFLRATNFCKNEPNVQFKVTTSGGIDYDQSDKYMRDLYARKSYLNPNYIYNEKLKFEYKGNKHDVTLCTSPVYNDAEYTEYLSLPLYRNFSIRKGAQNGADYACYLPSSIADELVAELGLNNYDELFTEDIVFNLGTSKNKCTMSVNNIYLNNDTKYWNDNDIEFDYHKTFAKRTNNAIFAYCPNFFRTIKNGSLCFDTNTSYDHFKTITNKTLGFLEDESIKYEYKITRDDGQVFSYNLSKQELKTNFGDLNHIAIYVGIVVMILNYVFLMISKEFRHNMMKPSLIASGIVITGVLVGEILKTIFSTAEWTFMVFNYIGNGIAIMIALYLVLFGYFFMEETDD